MRKYIRHPSDIPIEFKLGDVVAHKKDYLNDISRGGLSFKSNTDIEPGSVILIQIPIRKPMFMAEGVVVWSRRNDDYYDIGVEFKDMKTEFAVRMVEQVCYIEQYKKDVWEKEGRKISGEEAAVEWIKKHAGDFPA
ncbi:PilZ domain-containing protein [Candidatus Latescibacterota bacterium]